MILNTGNRTDIPAYYSEWFYNRIKEGFVLARNPYYPSQVTKFSLDPEVVDVLVFCTKNPAPMLTRLSEIDHFNQYWMVTITPYGQDVEPFVPSVEKVMESFKTLSRKVGIRAISWRYDPIFISESYSCQWHIETFARMVENLAGYTDNCIISFIDLYEKTKRNFPGVRAVSKAEQEQLVKAFVEIGERFGIRIKTCAENPELAKLGADVSGCLTEQVLERALGCSMEVPKTAIGARAECACLLGNDIGMYNTCGHGCKYCYANYDMEIVRENMKRHNPKSPLLIGEVQPGDVVRQANQEAYCHGQLRLDL